MLGPGVVTHFDSMAIQCSAIKTTGEALNFLKNSTFSSLKVVFKASYKLPSLKLSNLSKLKCELPVLSRSNVVYLIKCGNCSEFYIGKTERRLSQCIHEHATCENSALRRHELATDHKIDFDSVSVLASDNHPTRLLIKETLKIKEHCAFNSLNGNMGSFELRLF